MKEKKIFIRAVSIAIAITMCLTAISLTSVADEQKINLNRVEGELNINPVSDGRGTILQYHNGTAALYWTIPDPYGDDFFNERCTMPFDGTLDTVYLLFYAAGCVDVTGEGVDIIIWDDDGFGYPNTQLGSVNVPFASMDFMPNWTVVDVSGLGLSFFAGDDFHVGYTTVNQGAGNVMAILSDAGWGFANNLRSSEYWSGLWGFMFDDWGVDVDFMIAAEVSEDQEPWPDCKMHFPQLPDPFGWDVYADFFGNPMFGPMILADDFLCTESGPITDLHFWGSWLDDFIPEYPTFGAPYDFRISIHEDIPDPDGEGPLYSMPGDLLWERIVNYEMGEFECNLYGESPQGWFIPPDIFFPFDNHFLYFQYDVFFEEPYFIQEEDTIYWLDLAPMQDTAPYEQYWGWKTSLDHWNDDAVYSIIDEPLGVILSENFDSYMPAIPPVFPPAGWSVYNVDGGDEWIQYESNTHTGDYCSRCTYDSNNDDWLVSKPIVMPSSPVNFSVWMARYSLSYSDPCSIYYSTTGNTTNDFTSTGTLLWTGDPATAAPTYTEYSFNIPESEGTTVWFAVQYHGAYDWYVYTDDWTFPDGTTEGFEGGTPEAWPPAGWTEESVSGTYHWKINDTATHPSGVIPVSSPYMAEFDCYSIQTGNSGRLYTPAMNFGGTGHELTFYMYHGDGYSSNNDNLTVQVSTDGSIWTNITEFTRYDVTNPGWLQHTVILGQYDGVPTVYVGFLADSDWGDSIYIDDVEITGDNGGAAWGELRDPMTQESLDMAFVITGTGAETGTIIVEKQTIPDGAPDSFTFTGDAAGAISDDGQIIVAGLTPGTYTSTETVPAGWTLTSIVCDDNDSTGDILTATATFNLQAGETVTAVFTNTEDVVEELDVNQTLSDRGFRVMPGWDGAQDFKPNYGYLSRVDVYMTEWGAPWGPIVFQICEDSPTGTVLYTGSIDPSVVPSFPTFGWVTVDITDIVVTPGDTYVIVLRDGDDGDTHNALMWGWCDSYGGLGPYPDGEFLFRKLDFPTWLPIHDWDFAFKTYGYD